VTISNSSLVDVSFVIETTIFTKKHEIQVQVPIEIVHPFQLLERLPIRNQLGIYIPRGTLQDIVHDIQEPLRVEPLEWNESQFVSNATLQEDGLSQYSRATDSARGTYQSRKPLITQPSPVSKLHIPPPPSEAPSVWSHKGAKRIPNEWNGPKLDLDQEIDKLYQCVQMSN
jgi:hypothetical protein